MRIKVRILSLLLALSMVFICGCEGEAVSSKPAESSELLVATSSDEPVESPESPSSSKPAESSKEASSSKKPDFASTSSKKSNQKPTVNKTDENVNLYGNSQGNLNGGGWAAIQGDWIYYSTFDAFYKMKADGSHNQKIFGDAVSKINVVGDWVYFNRNDNDISRMKTDGSNYKVILKNVGRFVVANHKVYYTDSDTGYLYRVDENGANKVLLIKQDCDLDLNVTDDAIYWYGKDAELCIADINGKNIKCIKDFYPNNLIVDGDFMYYSSNLDVADAKTGKPIKQYFRETGGVGNMNISNGWIYFTYWEDSDCIYRLKTDGSQMQKLGNISATSLMVAGDWIFYVKMDYEHNDDGSISGSSSDRYRMRVDGSDNQMISKWDWSYFEW